jgi:hypothetical protein
MSRVSKVPERYLATAKKQAIKKINQGEYISAFVCFESALFNHEAFNHHVPLTKTFGIAKELSNGKITDKNVLIEHILKDF